MGTKQKHTNFNYKLFRNFVPPKSQEYIPSVISGYFLKNKSAWTLSCHEMRSVATTSRSNPNGHYHAMQCIQWLIFQEQIQMDIMMPYNAK